MNTQYDVLIVGSGMVGAALGCALGNSGLRVALIDANPPPSGWPEDSIDLRVSAITLASQAVFQSLGAWEAMTTQAESMTRSLPAFDHAGSWFPT